MTKEILNRLSDNILNLDLEGIQKAVKDALAAGLKPMSIIDGMVRGLNIVGQKYEEGEYFLAELIMGGEAMSRGMKALEPYLKKGDIKTQGKVVIGTVRGDLHDIGKNIVISLLQGTGFEVIDLGVDVEPDKFVNAVRKHQPDILAMSALLTATMPEMKTVLKELEKAGLRDRVKVLIGGSHVSPDYAKLIGADAAARDAVDGVNICKTYTRTKST